MKTVTGKICFITNLTGINGDMDGSIHKGFTIGKGKRLYWLIRWHQSGNCTVYRAKNEPEEGEALIPRWISGDQIITIHFKD